MPGPVGPQNKSQERRILIGSLSFNGQTHYTQITSDVQIDHDNDDAETVLWQMATPNVFWNMSKAEVIASFEALKISDSEYASVYQSAIDQLENEN